MNITNKMLPIQVLGRDYDIECQLIAPEKADVRELTAPETSEQ